MSNSRNNQVWNRKESEMQGLKFFTKTSNKNSWSIASFHSPHSLTWRWLLHFSIFTRDGRRAWPLFSSYNTNNAIRLYVTIPLIGVFNFQTQQPMWYRDLYTRLRDEQDQRDGTAWFSDSHPHKIHKPSPPPEPVIFSDGGESRH